MSTPSANAAEKGPSEVQEKRNKVEVIIRYQEATKCTDLKLTLSLNTTISKLKDIISKDHPGKPPVHEQVLICDGRVLKEAEKELREIFRRADEGPYNIHLVLKPKEASPNPPMAHNQEPTPTHQPPPMTASTSAGSPVVTVPYMMINPVVSAAYNAALAAVYPPPSSSNLGHGVTMPVVAGSSSSASLDRAQPSSSTAPGGGAPQTGQNQMVPAIAFFPLGIPVLVPAAAAQNQGFQLGQHPQSQHQQSVPAAVPQAGAGQAGAEAPQQVQRGAHRRHVHGRRPGVEGGPAAVRVRRGRVIVYRISFRSAIQLLILITFLFFYFSRERFLFSICAIVAVYLLSEPIRRILHRLQHRRDANGQPQRGIIDEILALLLSFISSVFPNWDADFAQNLGRNPDSPRNQQQQQQEPRHEPHPHAD